MTFGKETDELEAGRLITKCLDVGINCFDCADLYAMGRAEEMLGRYITGIRDEVILITKAYFPVKEGVNNAGLSRHYLIRAIDASLKRLNTDYIDIFYMHRFDARTDLEETLRTLEDLVSIGKIRYLGASNFAAWQVAKALGIQEKNGWGKLCSIQPMYNLVKRQAEVELLPLAEAENLAVLSYSPLAAGLLTGKYSGVNEPETGRLISNAIYQNRYGEPWMNEVGERFVAYAKQYGIDPTPLAIAWVASHPAITSVILGARNVKQLEKCLEVMNLELKKDEVEQISALSRTPAPATDRTEEIGPNSYQLR
jgi:aryl-alcohol dehydrogenase-like predicted oxidoreductase